MMNLDGLDAVTQRWEAARNEEKDPRANSLRELAGRVRGDNLTITSHSQTGKRALVG